MLILREKLLPAVLSFVDDLLEVVEWDQRLRLPMPSLIPLNPSATLDRRLWVGVVFLAGKVAASPNASAESKEGKGAEENLE